MPKCFFTVRLVKCKVTRFPETPKEDESTKVEIGEDNAENGNENISNSDLRDEISGQMKLFD